jgi:hypothetical protein
LAGVLQLRSWYWTATTCWRVVVSS